MIQSTYMSAGQYMFKVRWDSTVTPGVLEESEPVGRRFSRPIVMTPWNAKARRRWRRGDIPNTQRGDAACGLCGVRIGPDITGRPMCYGCGPKDMQP